MGSDVLRVRGVLSALTMVRVGMACEIHRIPSLHPLRNTGQFTPLHRKPVSVCVGGGGGGRIATG